MLTRVNKKNTLIILLLLASVKLSAQGILKGSVYADGKTLPYATIFINNSKKGVVANANGDYILENIPNGTYEITASFSSYKAQLKKITVDNNTQKLNFKLESDAMLDEIVVTGTLKPVSRSDTPVPVEVYSASFLKKNPTASIFEALQNVNGVRPQINCSVCNTGDIRINGLEGPYSLVLIDGMPIVSGLSTVYGLSGIPNSLIDQVEIIKGPASSLYGSEAIGGLINIITKLPENAPKLSFETFGTGWGEANFDLALASKVGKKAHALLGVNYFNYENPIDNNNDNFTDVTLQNRISVFQKWEFNRKSKKKFQLAGRLFYEDRWGGDMRWKPKYRGGDEIYGESIFTNRYELLGNYELPVKEKLALQFSYTDHHQNSVYGNTLYNATQRIGFTQLTLDKTIKKHDLLFGTAVRYNYYDDNTAATIKADNIFIPSFFVQNQIRFTKKNELLLGGRYDYNKRHGSILTPRIAYKFKPTEDDIIRLNAGTGFRTVNLFTEEHASLTGARDVIVIDTLKPERSYNANLNYLRKFYFKNGTQLSVDASAWYTHFSNAILPDYDTNPNQIIYKNLNGKAVTQGVSVNIDSKFSNTFKLFSGVTFQDVTKTENNTTKKQILTESFSGTWGISYEYMPIHLILDYTGNVFGKMRLPLLGNLDPRSEYSPTWSIQNIQFTYDGAKNFEFYAGIKNLLNWTPNKNNPFIIARSNDPFDDKVTYDDTDGSVLDTPDNPYALTFDPTYSYAPNQGRRLFFGLRYSI